MPSQLSNLELKLKKLSVLSQQYTDRKFLSEELHLSEKAEPNVGYKTTYVLTEGSGATQTTVGEIDIPKDFVVKSGDLLKIEMSGETPMIVERNGQEVTPAEPVPEGSGYTINSAGEWLDFTIQPVDETEPETHVCINITGLINIYVAGDGISISGGTISVIIAEDGSLELSGDTDGEKKLTLVVNEDNPNGLEINESGLTVNLVTYDTATSGGTNGAMSASDKGLVVRGNTDLLIDAEMASWFGYAADSDMVVNVLPEVGEYTYDSSSIEASYDPETDTIVLSGDESSLSYNSTARKVTINSDQASYDSTTDTISINQ